MPLADESVRKPIARRRPPRPPVTRRYAVAIISGLMLLAGVVEGTFAGDGARTSVSGARSGTVGSRHTASSTRASRMTAVRGCHHVITATGYVDPLVSATVTPERIDQGVDYAGRGTLVAIGSGTVSSLATAGTGWPGAFIEYRLSVGPDRGCYVYYAEGVTAARGLRVGLAVRAGQALATIIPGYPTGIELGWSAGIGTKTYAARMGEWNPRDDEDNIPSAEGRSFSALIASLGGPPGKVEGQGP